MRMNTVPPTALYCCHLLLLIVTTASFGLQIKGEDCGRYPVCACIAKSLTLMKSTFRMHLEGLEGFQQSAEVLSSCKIGAMFTA